MLLADQVGAAEILFENSETTNDQSPRYHLTDVRFGRQQFAKRLATESNGFRFTARAPANKDFSVAEEINLTRKLAIAMARENFRVAIAIEIEDYNASANDDIEIGFPLATFEDRFTVGQQHRFTQGSGALDLIHR
ncbi:MAG: hypothetical protein AAGD07_11670 [Planctomycetota bacterium]